MAIALAVTLVGRSVVLGQMTLPQLVVGTMASRYRLIPAALLWLALVIAVDRLPSGTMREVTVAATVAWFVVLPGGEFALEPPRETAWAAAAPELERVVRTGAQEPVAIPIDPPGWEVSVNRTLHWTLPAEAGAFRPVTVRARHAVARVFLSTCRHLNELALLLDRGASVDGMVGRFTLRTSPGGRVVAAGDVDFARARDGDWLRVAFPPLLGSVGVYALELDSPALRDRPLDLVALPSPSEPDAASLVGGTRLLGEVYLRIGCLQ